MTVTAERPDDRRRGADHQARLSSSCSIATNGTPLFPIEYQQVSGERRRRAKWRRDTQPLPTKPAPFARQVLTETLLTTRTPEAHAVGARASSRRSATAGQFVPLAVGKQTVVFPGFDGGAEWGGQAFDPDRPALRQRERSGVDRRPGAGRAAARAAGSFTCSTARRAIATIAPARRRRFPSLVGIGERRTRPKLDGDHPEGRGPHAGLPGPRGRRGRTRSSQYLVTGAETPRRRRAAARVRRRRSRIASPATGSSSIRTAIPPSRRRGARSTRST